MDKAGRGGARWDIVDGTALASLWERLRYWYRPYLPATRAYGEPLSLRALAARLGVDYHTAYSQASGPGYERWRPQMRPVTALLILDGMRDAVRRQRRRSDGQPDRANAELSQLWRRAVRAGSHVLLSHPGQGLPALPPRRRRRPSASGPLVWWVAPPPRQKFTADDQPHVEIILDQLPTWQAAAREAPAFAATMRAAVRVPRQRDTGHYAYLIGRMTPGQQRLLQEAAREALATQAVQDDPTALQLWYAIHRQLGGTP